MKQKTDNYWCLKYIDSIYETGCGEMTELKGRIVMTRQRFGWMRHIWSDKTLHQRHIWRLRIRLYKTSVCSVCLRTTRYAYGSETWGINEVNNIDHDYVIIKNISIIIICLI